MSSSSLGISRVSAYPIMPRGRPGRSTFWEFGKQCAVVWITAGWHVHVIDFWCNSWWYEDDQSMLIETSRCNHQFFSELITTQKRIPHGVNAKSLLINPRHHAKLQVLLMMYMYIYSSFPMNKANSLNSNDFNQRDLFFTSQTAW